MGGLQQRSSRRAAIYVNADFAQPFDRPDLGALHQLKPLVDHVDEVLARARKTANRRNLAVVGEYVDLESPLRGAGYKRKGYQLPGLRDLDRSIRKESARLGAPMAVEVVIVENLFSFRSVKDACLYFRNWIDRGASVVLHPMEFKTSGDVDLLELSQVFESIEELEAPELGPGRKVYSYKLRATPPARQRRIRGRLGRPRIDIAEGEIAQLFAAGRSKAAIKRALTERGFGVSLRTVGRRVEELRKGARAR